MPKTILFDLDGTLLPIDTDQFVRHYMRALAAHIGHLIPPPQLVEQVMAATEAMIRNTDPALTNAQVFAADFYPKVQRAETEMRPIFDEFYRVRFPELRREFPSLPGLGRQVVQAAVDQGFEIVLATNPLFPHAGILERMRWIGVEDMPWRLITTYEVMHACKPQPAYYEEILTKIRRTPAECLMIGNDVDEDGVAGSLGMDVFFVTDFLVNRTAKDLPPGRSGTLADVLRHLESGEFPQTQA